MGILGLGDHVAAIRPEDISGQEKQTRGQSSTTKKGNWGHFLVTVAAMITGGSADCIPLIKFRLPGCGSCSTDSRQGCADVKFYTLSMNGEEPRPTTDSDGNPYLWVGHGELNRQFVCESTTTNIDFSGGQYIHSAQIKLDSCYDYDEFDCLIRSRVDSFQSVNKAELYERYQADLKASEEYFSISRQALEAIQNIQSTTVVTLPSPTASYYGSSSSMLPTATPAPALL